MEKFSLKWNDFQLNVSKSFQRLRHEKEYSDVTLIGDDYQPVLAHKVVLSSSSEYFKNVLYGTRNHSNPVICMEGLNKGDLTNILDYIYNGELQINQEDLDTFLKIAGRLKLEGLTGQETYQRGNCSTNLIAPKIEFPKTSILVQESKNELRKKEREKNRGKKRIRNRKEKGKENEKIIIQPGDTKELNEMLEQQFSLDTLEGMYICKLCSKRSEKIHIMREHVEVHVDGFQFPCNICKKSYRSRPSLRNHCNIKHKVSPLNL